MSDWTPPSEDWRLQLPTEPQAAVQYLCFAIVGPPEGQRCAKCNVVFNRDNRGWFSVQRMGKPGATVGMSAFIIA